MDIVFYFLSLEYLPQNFHNHWVQSTRSSTKNLIMIKKNSERNNLHRHIERSLHRKRWFLKYFSCSIPVQEQIKTSMAGLSNKTIDFFDKLKLII